MRLDEVSVAIEKLCGLPCTRVKNSVGSISSLEFGDLAPSPDDPTVLHGIFSLMLYCPWRIDGPSGAVGDWNLPGGHDGRIASVLGLVVGATVTGVRLHPPSGDLGLSFSNRHQLFAFVDSSGFGGAAWVLFGRDGAEVSVKAPEY